MVSRAIWLAVFLTIPAAALAQNGDTQAGASDDFRNIAFYVLFALGFVFTGFNASQAYARHQEQLEDIPTFPRYMARRPIYLFAMAAYIAVSLLIYAIIVAFYEDFAPALDLVAPRIGAWVAEVSADQPLAYPLVIVVCAGFFATLLRWEHSWNIVLIIRTLIYRWAAVPRKVRGLSDDIKVSLTVPADARAAVVADPALPAVDDGDFGKDRQTMDRQWAEASYLYFWLKRQRRTGKHSTFFNEPSLLWESHDGVPGVAEEYNRLARPYERIKAGESLDDLARDNIGKYRTADEISNLHRKLRRIVACFLVYRNAREADLRSDALALGIPTDKPLPPSPVRLILIFAFSVLFSVLIGAFVSPILYDYGTTGNVGDIFGDYVWKWSVYSVGVTCVPLFLLLCMRHIMNRLYPRTTGFHLDSYAGYALFGLVAAGAVLTILSHDQPRFANSGLLDIFFTQSKWGAVTALLCAYVGYRLDKHATFETQGARVAEQIAAAAVLTAICIVIAYVIAFTHDNLPPEFAAAGWTLDKLRWVIVLTTLFLAAAVGLTAFPGRITVEDAPVAPHAAANIPPHAPGP